MPRPPTCPDERTLRSFAAGMLAAAAAADVRAHVAKCERCRAALPDLVEGEPTGVEPAADDLDRGTVPADSPTRTELRAESIEEELNLPFLYPAADPEAIGLIGGYVVKNVLGRGGMGVVLDAFDPALHRRVAIKVLSPHLANSARAHKRFLREARAAATINHPNVVTIHAVAEQAGMPYLVMEYVAGRTLRDRIRQAPPDLTAMLRIGAQIAAGLGAAHQHGVIHRDIKPANILLEDGIERVKITDFGLARVVLDASDLSSADRPVGTPAYMSPEQVGGAQADARSDLFSFGCVLYAMATGRSPFQGANTLDIARRVADFSPPPVQEENPAVPRFLSDVVARLLAKNPRDRFQSAKEVRDLLLQHLAAANQGASDLFSETLSLPLPRRKRRRWVLAGLATLVLIGITTAAAAHFWNAPNPLRTAAAAGKVVTVSQNDPADFRDLREAVASAGPGAIVRVLDAAVYQGPVRVGARGPQPDLTIEAPNGATVENTSSLDPVVTIDRTPGVTIRGLKICARDRQHCVSVTGACRGLTLDNVHVETPSDSQFGAVVLSSGACGSADRPIVLRNLDVRCGEIGVVLIGSPELPTAHVRIENSRFTGPGVHVAIDNAVRDVTIAGNIFTSGLAGVSFSVEKPQKVQRLTVANNSFFQMTSWLALERTSLEQGEVAVRNNLIVQCTQIKLTGQDLASVAPQWFGNNWWERGSDADQAQAALAAEVKDEVKLLSRDPDHADFLRPAPGTMPPAADSPGLPYPYVGAGAGPTSNPECPTMTSPYSFGFAQQSPGRFYDDPVGGAAASMSGNPYSGVSISISGATGNSGLSMAGPGPGMAYREPEPARPLRVTHVGQSMVRAGIESWLKGLMRFLDPRRVQVVKCIATAPEEVDPAVIAELRVPVEVGGADCVRRAARECDILFCWGPRDLGAWLAPARPALCVLVAHGEGYWTRQIVEGCAAVTDHVVAVSRRVRERVAHDLPATVIPNGVDTIQLARTRSAADVRQNLGFRPDDFVLGYVGRFSDEKQPHLVIEAVARLPAPFKALFVGWGPLGPRLMDYANRLIPGRYAFVKGVNDVGDYYAALDALCVPSAEEGFGLVVVEAMFCERPVIATAVGCVPDLIRDRVNGMVVTGSPESIAEAAQLLRHHPAWARGLAAEGRATAEQHCHALAMARAYEDLLLRLWREKTAGPAPRQASCAM